MRWFESFDRYAGFWQRGKTGDKIGLPATTGAMQKVWLIY